MSKRSSPITDEDSQGASTDEPIRKRRLVEFEPVRICSINATSEIDAKVLAVQNYKLSERFKHKERQRDQLQKRVEQLESRQAQDDAMLCIINRFWNRFDEDVRILLERFDAETALEGEIEMEYEGTKNFLAKLSHWENDEIEDKLKQRVEFSRRAIAKMVQVFDHITQRNEKIATLIASCPTSDQTNDGASTSEEDATVNNHSKPSINGEVARMNEELSGENVKLQKIITKLQSENHILSLKASAQEDELSSMETRHQEMSNSLDEVKYQLEKSMRRECKLDFRLADLEELELNVDMQSELATSRLQELQEMLEKNKNLMRQVETLKLNLKHTPSDVIKKSTEYIALQSQYSALFMETAQMRQQLEVARTQMASLRSAHAKQIEFMEEQLSQVRKEYEMLRLEFEQNLSANEQSGPVNKEIRMLLTSFKTQNEQLKQESSRFKRKWKEAVSLLAKCNKELEGEKRYRERCLMIEIEEESDSLASPDQDKNSSTTTDGCASLVDGCVLLEHGELLDNEHEGNTPSHKTIQKLKKTVLDLQTKLDALNSLSTEQRDRFEILARERRLKQENEKMQSHLRKLVGADRREKMRYYADDAQRKIRSLEELNERLRKEAQSAKQQEEGLTREMDTTGEAFEDMQEQNTRLLQQLKEKDDANLKLMAERIRANQCQKKMNEERERTEERLSSLQNQIEAQQLMISKLEEKDKVLTQKNVNLEHQLRMVEQAMEMHKRKAIECSQSSADLKAQFDKCSSQLNDAQQAMISKTSQQEVDTFKIRRLEEDKNILKKKLERAKKMEKMDNMDEVLNEEIRELKDILTCPSCKVRRKDAILTKCFHVFCMECLKTRYETRRRKCPKCNAAFGANDYRRMYFS
ncbi:unnamed protein product [Anisakis simplex]|uniref:E3 ubiquitin protein ligase n=1 Tax=Anisakis simplex TaxID=6269 RepID=A0A158PPC9_ANISI|nr:unnamed protein product [Anisakis simplex]